MGDAGRILIMPVGVWNAQTEYVFLDAVSYQGSMYIAKKASRNVTPEDGEYWFLSAAGANTGAEVHSFNNRIGHVVPAKNDYDIAQISAEDGTLHQAPLVNSDGELELTSLLASFIAYGTRTLENIGDIVTKSISSVETSATASFAHANGSSFIDKDGNYCRATSNISVGDTIAVGTNCEIKNIDERLAEIKASLATINTTLQGINTTLAKKTGYPDYANMSNRTSTDLTTTKTDYYTVGNDGWLEVGSIIYSDETDIRKAEIYLNNKEILTAIHFGDANVWTDTKIVPVKKNDVISGVKVSGASGVMITYRFIANR